MTEDTRLPWILAGYATFAKEGPSGLKVEALARQVGKSKSSFYHHFAELEVFSEALMDHHLERARIMADRERACQNVVPELLHVILEFKEDLLFNRQLRVLHDVPEYAQTCERVSEIVGEAILGIWAQELGLTQQTHLAGVVLKMSLENFFLQLSESTLSYDWLENYIGGIRGMVQEFQRGVPMQETEG